MGANLADLVASAAVREPDAPAVICAGRTTSWAELDRLVRAVAGGLIARRLNRGDRVALLLGNSLEFVSSYFGILRAGMVAVPLNTAYTDVEVTELIAGAGARLIICDKGTSHVARASAGPDAGVVEVGTDGWRRLTVGSTPLPDDETDPESLAVLMFTSGTSGSPKGAMLTHRALLANIDQLSALENPPAMLPEDVVLAILPLFHVYALNATLGMVARHAATAVLVERFDAARALELVRMHDVTYIAGAPPMYVAWSAVPEIAERLGSVRLLISGAAPLPVTIFDEFATQGLPVWEGYGLTECSPVVATTLASGQPKAGSVGRAIPGVEVQIRDSHGQEVDDGDPGEVFVRGANVFSGYWPDGADGPDAEGWFGTGDIALVDSDGDLHLVDRRRDLILVSGFNVYPREIETTIAAMSGVAEVAVVGVPHPYSGEAVKALVVASPGAELSTDQILEFCAGRLARFKSPTIVEIVAQLPHTPTGKISRASLREFLESSA